MPRQYNYYSPQPYEDPWAKAAEKLSNSFQSGMTMGVENAMLRKREKQKILDDLAAELEREKRKNEYDLATEGRKRSWDKPKTDAEINYIQAQTDAQKAAAELRRAQANFNTKREAGIHQNPEDVKTGDIMRYMGIYRQLKYDGTNDAADDYLYNMYSKILAKRSGSPAFIEPEKPVEQKKGYFKNLIEAITPWEEKQQPLQSAPLQQPQEDPIIRTGTDSVTGKKVGMTKSGKIIPME
jgi:hypothetical protein